jgi:hypothetical protein
MKKIELPTALYRLWRAHSLARSDQRINRFSDEWCKSETQRNHALFRIARRESPESRRKQ